MHGSDGWEIEITIRKTDMQFATQNNLVNTQCPASFDFRVTDGDRTGAAISGFEEPERNGNM